MSSQAITFKEFYDPNNVLESEASTLDYLETVRPDGLYIRGLGYRALHSIVLAESLHARVAPVEAEPEDFFRVPEDEFHEVRFLVDRDVEGVVAALHETVDEVRYHMEANIPTFKKPEFSDIVIAGMVLAAKSSEGVVRESGRGYYSHPHEVAKLIAIAARKFNGLSKDRLDDLLFLAYCHDAYEDTFSKVGDTPLKHDVLTSPRLVKELFRSYDRENGEEIAETLMLFSKPIGPDGKMDYIPYIQRGIKSESPYFILGKLADNHHNRIIEPKIAMTLGEESEKIARKQEIYRESEDMLLQAANDLPTIDLIMMAHSIMVVSKADMMKQYGLGVPVRPSEMAKIFTDNVNLQRGAY